RRAFLAQESNGLRGFDGNLFFLPRELQRPGGMATAAIGFGSLVEFHCAVVNDELHGEHPLEAGFEHRQEPIALFFAKLTQDLLELLLGLLEIGQGVVLSVRGLVALFLLEVLDGPFHVALGLLEFVAAGRLLRRTLRRLSFAGLSFTRLSLAGLAFAGL